jgi:hypothetical protein
VHRKRKTSINSSYLSDDNSEMRVAKRAKAGARVDVVHPAEIEDKSEGKKKITIRGFFPCVFFLSFVLRMSVTSLRVKVPPNLTYLPAPVIYRYG